MDLKSKLALLHTLWDEVQAELFNEYEGNEQMESASDDITIGIFQLSTLKK